MGKTRSSENLQPRRLWPMALALSLFLADIAISQEGLSVRPQDDLELPSNGDLLTLDAGALLCAGAPGNCFISVEQESSNAQKVKGSCGWGGLPDFASLDLEREAESGNRRQSGGIEFAVLAQPKIGAGSYPRAPLGKWITSGVWIDGTTLALLDVKACLLHLVSIDDQPSRIGYLPAGQCPTLLARSKTRLVGHVPTRDAGNSKVSSSTEDEIARAVAYSLDKLEGPSAISEIESTALVPLEVAGGGILRAIYDWSVGDKQVMVFGDVYDEKTGWVGAFVEISFGPLRGKIVYKMPIDSLERRYYLVGQRNLAFDGLNFFALLNTHEGASVVRLTGQQKEIVLDILGPSAVQPLSEEVHGRDSFRALEQGVYAAGLFAWRGHLYVMSKGVDPGVNSYRWTIARVDPECGSVRQVEVLDSESEYLMAVPHDSGVALIRKGPVVSLGNQQILGVRYLLEFGGDDE